MGTDIVERLELIYRVDSQFCVIFVSSEYAMSQSRRLERRSALARAPWEEDEYILPVHFDDTELPGLLSTTGYISLDGIAPSTLAALIAEKMAGRKARA